MTLTGIPGESETWARWEAATGRTVPIADRPYWKAFGAMILAITATRFMVNLGMPAGHGRRRQPDRRLVADHGRAGDDP